MKRWWNWREYLEENHPDQPATFAAFQRILRDQYSSYTFDFAAAESGVAASTIQAVAETVAGAGTRLSTHNWRSAAAGNLGGWQVARSLFMLNALLGAIAVPGGTYPNSWNKFVPRPIRMPSRHPKRWNDLTWPADYPLSLMEMSFLLPHLTAERKGRLDVYFTRVYNPVWTNPDGFSWIEMLADPERIGLHVAITPTWNETAYFADYVLPMGHSSERHDLTSYEQYDGRWLGFRQPVLRAARQRLGEEVRSTLEVNPGEVWEENEFWIELTWRIDPDGSRGIRSFFESRRRPGEKLSVDEYYGWIFENSVPGLPEKAAQEGLTPLEYMRRYGAFEIDTKVGAMYEEKVPESELVDLRVDGRGRAFTPRAGSAAGQRCAPAAVGRRRGRTPPGGGRGRGRGPPGLPDTVRAAGVLVPHPGGVGMAGVGRARLRPQPCPPPEHGPRPDVPDLHLPAARAYPHSQRERQMAERDCAHEPALVASARRGPYRGRNRGAGPGRDPASATSWSKLGSRKGSTPESRPVPITWDAGS